MSHLSAEGHNVQRRKRKGKVNYMSNKGKVRIWKGLLMLACLVTIFSPIDMIPDFIPALGWIDDACAVLYPALSSLYSLYAFLRNKVVTKTR